MSTNNKEISMTDGYGTYDKDDYKNMLAVPDSQPHIRRLRLLTFLFRCIPGVTDTLVRPKEDELKKCYDQLLDDIKKRWRPSVTNDALGEPVWTDNDSSCGQHIVEDFKKAESKNGFPWEEKHNIGTEEGKDWQKLFFLAGIHVYFSDFELLEKQKNSNFEGSFADWFEMRRQNLKSYLKDFVFDEWLDSYEMEMKTAEGVYLKLG